MIKDIDLIVNLITNLLTVIVIFYGFFSFIFNNYKNFNEINLFKYTIIITKAKKWESFKKTTPILSDFLSKD